MDAGFAPQPIVDAGFASQPIVDWDTLIVEFAVIPGYKSSFIKSNPFGWVAIVASHIAL
jgi:hypothetical protein